MTITSEQCLAARILTRVDRPLLLSASTVPVAIVARFEKPGTLPPAEEAADLSAQLPVLVRGIFFEGWQSRKARHGIARRKDFVFRISRDLDDDMLDVDTAIAAVFRLLDRHISPGEIRQVRDSMKKSLRQLWPTH